MTLRNLLLVALCVTAAPALAAERTMIVLDASGSMWGTIDGKPKLEIARAALKQTLAQLPPGTEVGLMAYGHREKGNCADIEVVVPPAPGAGAKIAQAADKLRFLGKTPLSESVRQAAAALRATEDKATVILITDGVETCNADPCALADELETSGVDFTAHVVGFGLTREEGRQVACLAERTGGRYIRAGNQKELSEALAKTVAETVAAPAAKAKPAPVKVPQASVATTAKPAIGANFDVTWTGPGDAEDYVDLVPAGTKEIGGELSYAFVDKKTPSATLRAPGKPGTYDVRYVWTGPDKRHVLATAQVEVGDAKVALLAPASLPAGTAFEVTWKGPGQQGDYVDIVPKGHQEPAGEIAYWHTDSGNPAKLKAPGDPGAYELRYVLDAAGGRKVLVSVPLEVTKASAHLAFPPAAPGGTDFTVSWQGPNSSGDYVDIVPADHTETSGEITYAFLEHSQDGETVDLKLPGKPGAYVVRYILDAAGGRRELVRAPLTVEPPKPATLKAPARVKAGAKFAVAWTGPNGKGDYVDLVAAGQQEAADEIDYAHTESTDGKTAELTAPEAPGRYDIRYVLEAPDGRQVIARTTIEVR